MYPSNRHVAALKEHMKIFNQNLKSWDPYVTELSTEDGKCWKWQRFTHNWCLNWAHGLLVTQKYLAQSFGLSWNIYTQNVSIKFFSSKLKLIGIVLHGIEFAFDCTNHKTILKVIFIRAQKELQTTNGFSLKYQTQMVCYQSFYRGKLFRRF